MLKTHLISIALVFSLFSLFSCLDDEAITDNLTPTEEEGYFDVDPRLWSYYDIFEAEGKARGINVDLKRARISGDIDEIDERK